MRASEDFSTVSTVGSVGLTMQTLCEAGRQPAPVTGWRLCCAEHRVRSTPNHTQRRVGASVTQLWPCGREPAVSLGLCACALWGVLRIKMCVSCSKTTHPQELPPSRFLWVETYLWAVASSTGAASTSAVDSAHSTSTPRIIGPTTLPSWCIMLPTCASAESRSRGFGGVHMLTCAQVYTCQIALFITLFVAIPHDSCAHTICAAAYRCPRHSLFAGPSP